jgi:hypothetical protein
LGGEFEGRVVKNPGLKGKRVKREKEENSPV